MDLPPRLRPRKTPAQGRSRALVDAVLEAGSRILIQRGYEGLTMSAVAQLAGVSVGSLYQYFPNKESIVAALIEQRSEAETEYVGQRVSALDPSLPFEKVLLRAVRAALEFRALAPELQAALLGCVPFIGGHPRLAARGECMMARLQAVLAPRFERVRAEDPDIPPLEHVLFVMINAIYSLTHEGLVKRPAALDDDELACHISHLVTSYVRTPRRRKRGSVLGQQCDARGHEDEVHGQERD